jgi:hypothetical protein
MNEITHSSEMMNISIKQNNLYRFRDFVNCQKIIINRAKLGETKATCYLSDEYIKMFENKGYKINNNVVSWDS